jgi:DNA mismatch endonuclease (patch repair protein)
VDVLTPSQRSFNMSRIRSRWTAQERELHALLKGRKVRHRMHPPLAGNPDVLVLPNLVVFIHGCFWHGCRACYVPPKTRQHYWHPKIDGNRARDRRNTAAARRAGFRVLSLWEHQFKRDAASCVSRITRAARLNVLAQPGPAS